MELEHLVNFIDDCDDEKIKGDIVPSFNNEILLSKY